MFAIIIINFYCSWLKQWRFPLKWVLVTHSHEGGQLSWMKGKEKGCREDSHKRSADSHLSCRSRAFCTWVLTVWEWTWLRQRGWSPAVKWPQFISDILYPLGPLLLLLHLYLIFGHQQYRIKHFHNCFPEGENKWKICMCLPKRSSDVGFSASGSWAHRSSSWGQSEWTHISVSQTILIWEDSTWWTMDKSSSLQSPWGRGICLMFCGECVYLSRTAIKFWTTLVGKCLQCYRKWQLMIIMTIHKLKNTERNTPKC